MHIPSTMKVVKDLHAPLATAQLVRYEATHGTDAVFRVEDAYRLDVCLAPRPQQARVCYREHWGSDRFERMLLNAVAVACASAMLGTLISFHINGATGACIVLVQACFFLVAFLFGPKHGLMTLRGLRQPEGGGAPAPRGVFGSPRASLSAFAPRVRSAARFRRSKPSTNRSA